jgi:hypothetical protein
MIKLYLMDGVDEIQSFDLPGDTVHVGRSSENQIRMKDGYVSGSHLKIIEKGDRYFVQDMGSTNGTFVNGHPIPPDAEVEVEEGVPITIGMSLICLGRACLDHVMPFVDAIFESENLNEVVERYQKRDQPMTARNTMELVYSVSTVLRNSVTLNEIMEQILDSIFKPSPANGQGAHSSAGYRNRQHHSHPFQSQEGRRGRCPPLQPHHGRPGRSGRESVQNRERFGG